MSVQTGRPEIRAAATGRARGARRASARASPATTPSCLRAAALAPAPDRSATARGRAVRAPARALLPDRSRVVRATRTRSTCSCRERGRTSELLHRSRRAKSVSVALLPGDRLPLLTRAPTGRHGRTATSERSDLRSCPVFPPFSTSHLPRRLGNGPRVPSRPAPALRATRRPTVSAGLLPTLWDIRRRHRLARRAAEACLGDRSWRTDLRLGASAHLLRARSSLLAHAAALMTEDSSARSLDQ